MNDSNPPEPEKRDYAKSIELASKCEKSLRLVLKGIVRIFLLLLWMLFSLIAIIGIMIFDAWATMYWPGYKEFFHNGGIHNEIYYCSQPISNPGESIETSFAYAKTFNLEFKEEPGRGGADVPELCRAIGNLDARTSDESRFDRERFPERADN